MSHTQTQAIAPEFNAAMYWANKPIKKYVCTIRENQQIETRIFAATSSDRAAELAMDCTDLDRESAVVVDIHLATPQELGCEPVQPAKVDMVDTLNAIAKDHRLKVVELRTDTGHLLLGTVPAINAVNELECQRDTLASALVACLEMMDACKQYDAFSDKWISVQKQAIRALKGGK